MRIPRIWLALLLGVWGLALAGCGSGGASAVGGQLRTVERGDLKISVTGVGNLALSDKRDLAFEMDGTVLEVLVEEAQSVEAGQVLVRLSASDWQEQLVALEDKVTAAERNVTAKGRAVTSAERTLAAKEQAVIQAERNVAAKELAVLQAQANLNNAQLSLEQTQAATTDPLQVEIKRLQVQVAQGNLEAARQALEDARTIDIDNARQAVEDARAQVGDAELAVQDAQKALSEARSNLDEARNKSPEITAPFAGFITRVNVSGGDEVKKGTVAVVLADPAKFEADIPVSELDILQIKLGGTAEVQVDAVSGVTLPARVTRISPTATISQGVVNYKVKVELLSTSLAQAQSASTPVPGAASDNVTGASGSFLGRGNYGDDGFTQEELSAMLAQRQSGQLRQSAAQLLADLQLKEGLTVTVSIVTDSKANVLLVPNSAITTRGGQAFVQVPGADGALEQRAIQTGISDYQYTEVTGGLNEGEQVMVTTGTTATTTSGQTGQRQGGTFVPGGGVILR
ncbi:MAG: HlyD family efflux transporter periplasmic adaptor subunit [Dehalococcoidia bacterium]|nr:MAG: HlyD family efflux transporter periplasmic adaptor subunit [Dehalococcoidia bacterium]